MNLESWERQFTHRIIVDGEVSLGELCEMVRNMWEDAANEGWEAAIDDAQRQPWRYGLGTERGPRDEDMGV